MTPDTPFAKHRTSIFPKEIILICWVGSKANSQRSIHCKCEQIIVIIIKTNVISALCELLKLITSP